VWVSDLQRYYGEAARILKPDGLLIVSEYHPYRRVWLHSASSLEIGFNYFDRGPHRFEATPDVLYPEPGELQQFEFHWTVADYITAILASGCRLVHAEEFGDTSGEWEGAPSRPSPNAPADCSPQFRPTLIASRQYLGLPRQATRAACIKCDNDQADD
jgi:SAM-dependent methyltransferase